MARELSERRIRRSSNFPFKGVLLLIAVVCLVGGVFAMLRLFEWERPTIKLAHEVTLLGQKTTVEALITDRKTGLREVRAIIRQGKKDVVVVERQLGRNSLFSRGVPSLQETLTIDTVASGLSDGKAELLIYVSDLSWWNWGRGNQTLVALPVTIDTKPPRLRLIDSPAGIKPGSSGIIVYGANEEVLHSGVTIDGIFHPGFPIPARKGGAYGAMIGIPYDTVAVKSATISGQDRAGNKTILPIAIRIYPVKQKSDTINLSDNFLNTKVPEFEQYYPAMKGSMLEQFLYVNNEVRKQNAARIKEVCSQTDPERHWQGHFRRMEHGAPLAGYAQYRSYVYQGKVVDHQVHLGVDLASLQRAKVEAANAGKVVYADYLGIYGNMVMIDHGQGVFSLYAHMSEIKVKVGEMVQTGDELGLTGATGMAGGDHLHFSMLINGVFVTPVEWWDQHWIKDNILLFMQDAKTGS
jgi:murein DD-endopeptidase MepM/ murein hydrolase activator NlpD